MANEEKRDSWNPARLGERREKKENLSLERYIDVQCSWLPCREFVQTLYFLLRQRDGGS